MQMFNMRRTNEEENTNANIHQSKGGKGMQMPNTCYHKKGEKATAKTIGQRVKSYEFTIARDWM